MEEYAKDPLKEIDFEETNRNLFIKTISKLNEEASIIYDTKPKICKSIEINIKLTSLMPIMEIKYEVGALSSEEISECITYKN